MRIAILGTKGIPNNYGGFEQFAEYLSTGLVNRGHFVTVYNPDFHPYSENNYRGVRIVRIFSPENYIGSAANFIYDHLCLKHALEQDFDIIYEAGYHSVALSIWGLGIRKRKSPVLLTNMDGLEWKRTKWNYFVKQLIKGLEKIAVNHSHHLVSDNIGIQEYYKRVFSKDSFYIPYGADVPAYFDEQRLSKYLLQKSGYFIAVARLEPENNLEPIINGFCQSSSSKKLVIVGNLNRYGKFLQEKYKDQRILFTGGIYDKADLDAVRHFSVGYFHGHSVGGTNPSLLEAMACSCYIMAHQNPFNKSVLQESADYFNEPADITKWVDSIESNDRLVKSAYIEANKTRIQRYFNW
ncbi:MAG: DUF1972 domain-containing protein, partial [Cytophagia bacterium]|nr:DUF1972 domain-containing protein [Cytophagia bacterium]